MRYSSLFPLRRSLVFLCAAVLFSFAPQSCFPLRRSLVFLCAAVLFSFFAWLSEISIFSDKVSVFVLPLTYAPQSSLRIDLGEVGESRRLVRPLRFENRTSRPVDIARIDTGCDCVMFVDAITTIEPYESSMANVVVDLRDDVGFEGLLGVSATGFDGVGRKVFVVVVNARAGS